MQIDLFTTMAGPDGVRKPGRYDLPNKQARDLVDAGAAAFVEAPRRHARPKPEAPDEETDADDFDSDDEDLETAAESEEDVETGESPKPKRPARKTTRKARKK